MTPKTTDKKSSLFKSLIKLGDGENDEKQGSAEKPSNMIKVGKEIQTMTKQKEKLDEEIKRLEAELEELKETNGELL